VRCKSCNSVVPFSSTVTLLTRESWKERKNSQTTGEYGREGWLAVRTQAISACAERHDADADGRLSHGTHHEGLSRFKGTSQ
jgi:hypothetical protein